MVACIQDITDRDRLENLANEVQDFLKHIEPILDALVFQAPKHAGKLNTASLQMARKIDVLLKIIDVEKNGAGNW